MQNDLYLILPVFFPILAGIVTFFFKKTKMTRPQIFGFAAVIMVVEVILTAAACTGSRSLVLAHIADQLVISFHVDTMGRIFGILSVVVWLLVGIYSFEYMSHLKDETRFYGFYLIVEGTLVGLAFADNLFAYYVFFEAMSLTSVAMVLHELTEKAIMAGLKYLFYSVAGAFLALFGIFFLSRFGSLNPFAAGGMLYVDAADHKGLVCVCAFLMIVGFGTKAGMFPMHGWLPTAHPEAPAPASAVLSGVITKMGVLAVIRCIYYVIGPEYLIGTWTQYAWMTLALITVFLGSMMAYKEKVTKKRLAYSTVSQVSYIMFGLSCMHPVAFVGAILHVVCHSMIKNTLFMGAGAFIYKKHKMMVADLRGVGKEMPIVVWCFTLVSIALIGIPPPGGFVSKWYLAMGSLEAGCGAFAWLGPVILLVSALLTAGYLLPVTINGFFPGNDYNYEALESKEPSWLMLAPMVIMTAAAVVIGMFPNPLIDLINTAVGTIF